MVDLEKICLCSLNLKIISFFHENPSTVDTAHSIAAWLNHDYTEIKTRLDYLVTQRILNSHRTGSTVAYCLTQDKKIINGIEKFLQKRYLTGGEYV